MDIRESEILRKMWRREQGQSESIRRDDMCQKREENPQELSDHSNPIYLFFRAPQF